MVCPYKADGGALKRRARSQGRKRVKACFLQCTGAPPRESGNALWPAHHGSAEPPDGDSSFFERSAVTTGRSVKRRRVARRLRRATGWVLPSISDGPEDVWKAWVKTSLGQPRGGTFSEVGFSGVPHRVGCREAELSTSAQPSCEDDSGFHSSERMAAPPGEAVVEASISVSVVRTKLLDRLTGPLRRANESTEEDALTSV